MLCIYIYFLQPVSTNTQLAIPSILYSLNLPRPFCYLIEVHNMKPSLHSGPVLFFLFFLVFSSKVGARPLTTDQGQNRKLDEVSGEGFVLELEGDESSKLLGMEECNSGDEECFMRRMTLEAHIDYIYTQHHKP